MRKHLNGDWGEYPKEKKVDWSWYHPATGERLTKTQRRKNLEEEANKYKGVSFAPRVAEEDKPKYDLLMELSIT